MQAYRCIDWLANQLDAQAPMHTLVLSTSSCSDLESTSSFRREKLSCRRHGHVKARHHVARTCSNPSTLDCLCFDCRSTFQGKLSGLTSSEKASADDRIADANRVGSWLESKHSFKVFPEELVGPRVLSDTCERGEKLGSMEDQSEALALIKSTIQSPEKLSSHTSDGFLEGHVEAVMKRDVECFRDMVEIENSHVPLEAEALTEWNMLSGLNMDMLMEVDDVGFSNCGHGTAHVSVDVRMPKVPAVVQDISLDTLLGAGDCDVFELRRRLIAQREIVNSTFLKLEKERTASALAADGAMATITKLQEGKAALQMEAVQQQRVTEEREMFDEEVIAELRDVLIKREAGMLALEKEIDVYRRRSLEGQVQAVERCGPSDGVVFYKKDGLLLASEGVELVAGQSNGDRLAMTLGDAYDLMQLDTVNANTPHTFSSTNRQIALERIWYLEKQVHILRCNSFLDRHYSLAGLSNQEYVEDKTKQDLRDGKGVIWGDEELEDVDDAIVGSIHCDGPQHKDHREESPRASEDEDCSERPPESVGISHLAPEFPSGCDWRSASMIKRDESRAVLEDDVRELMSRLCALEEDREEMRQTIHWMRKESGVAVLQEAAQQFLRLLQATKDGSRTGRVLQRQREDIVYAANPASGAA